MVKKDRCFQIITNVILTMISLFCMLPFLLLFSSAFSNESAIMHEGYSLLPRQFDLTAFNYILNGSTGIMKSYGMSIITTVIGTILNLMITVLFAYPISRADLKGRSIISFYLFFTILFNGGLIPAYMMWTNIFQIKNTIFAYLLPNLLVNGFFVIMARNYFSQNIPGEVIESAKMDGAGEFKVLLKIVMPMSKPILGT